MQSEFATGGTASGAAGAAGIRRGLGGDVGVDSVNARMARLPAQMGSTGQAAGAQAASGIASGLASADYDGAGRSIASKVGGGLMSALKGIGKAGGIAGVLFGGAALKSGLDRLTTIEDATNSLKTIMGDAGKAAALMGEIKKTVQGTPFNLDQFADAGKNLVAMNVAAEKVPGYLTAIGEAAAASGKGAEGVSMLTDTFGKMAAQGQVSLDQIWSISNTGVPALQILANHFGVTTDAMKDMVSKGSVPAGEAMDALTKGIMEGSNGMAGSTRAFAGTMEGLRQTFTGALGGMKASMARFGAAFIGPWMPLITKTFGGVTGGLDALAPKIQAFSERLANSKAVTNFADNLKNLPQILSRVGAGFSGVYSILAKGDFTGAKNTFGLDEDSKVVDTLFRIRDAFTGVNTAMAQGKPLLDAFKSADSSGGGIGSALGGFASGLGQISVGTVTVLGVTTRALGTAMGFLADHSSLVVPILIGLAAAMATAKTVETGYHAAMIARTPAMYAQVAATLLQRSTMAAHTAALNANTVAMGGQLPVEQRSTIAKLASAAADKTKAAASAVATAATRAYTFATSGNVIATTRATAAAVAHRIASVAISAATKAWAAAQWLLNAAMSANPIGIIVVAIVALVAGLVLAYKKSETFRNIVQSVWEWIQKAADAVKNGLVAAFNWLKDALSPVINFIKRFWSILVFGLGPIGIIIGVITQLVKHWDTVKSVFATVWGVIRPILSGFMTGVKILGAVIGTVVLGTVFVAWNMLKAIFAGVWSFIGPLLGLFVAGIKGLGQAALWLWNNAILPAFNGIKAAAQLWWTGVQVIFGWVKLAFQAVGDAFVTVANVTIIPLWNLIKAAANLLWLGLQQIWSWIQLGFQTLGTILSAIANAVIMPVWNAIKAAAGFMWTGIQTIFGWFQAGWAALGTGLQVIKDSVIIPVWNAVKAGIDVLWNGLQTVFGWIKSGWDALGNGIRVVVDSVITPAWNAVKSGLQSVGDFFGTIVDGIGTAWDKVKGFVAKPINFVIDTVWNNGLLKAWNIIAGFLPGLKQMSPLSPVAFAEGGAVPMGHGAQRGKDSVHALMMPDEHVWDVADVRAAGGHDVMYAMRSLIERGIPFTWGAVQGLEAHPAVASALASLPADTPDIGGFLHAAQIPGYAEGGAVRPAWETQLETGHKWAQAQNGKPYLTGNQFPAGADCSGFMSALAGVILGQGEKAHWSTVAFPAGQGGNVSAGGQPWVPGLSQGFSIGIKGGPDSGGQNGHTAGTLSGAGNFSSVNVESGGSHGGIAYGGPAAGADDGQFPGRYHLAIGADGAFEAAGGPSRSQQEGLIKKKVKEILDKALDPIKNSMASVIGAPPPEWLGIPPKALTETKDKAVDTTFDVVTKLGDQLRAVYNKAKDITSTITNIVTSPVRAIGGLFRDNGGYIPNGMSVVRNETGRPEAVLNWDQLNKVRELVEATGKAAGESTIKDVTDFFGFSKLYDAISGVFTKQQNGAATTSTNGADAATAGTQQSTTTGAANPDAATTTQSATGGGYQDPTYGDGSTVQQGTTQLQTKMPDMNGPEGYAQAIAQAAKDAGVGRRGAIIGEITALTEVGDPLKMYANSKLPESLKFPHDAVGSDGTSVGLFQQQDNGAWGTLAQRMDAHDSAMLFYNALKGVSGWESMDMGAAAQAVQRSAFPDRYAQKIPRGTELVDKAGVFDQGGWLKPGQLALNLSRRPEPILNGAQWQSIDAMLENLPSAREFQAVADIAASRGPSASAAEVDDAATGPGRGPLVYVENQYTHDPSESARETGREVRRAVRSDSLVGGWA